MYAFVGAFVVLSQPVISFTLSVTLLLEERRLNIISFILVDDHDCMIIMFLLLLVFSLRSSLQVDYCYPGSSTSHVLVISHEKVSSSNTVIINRFLIRSTPKTKFISDACILSCECCCSITLSVHCPAREEKSRNNRTSTVFQTSLVTLLLMQFHPFLRHPFCIRLSSRWTAASPFVGHAMKGKTLSQQRRQLQLKFILSSSESLISVFISVYCLFRIDSVL